MTRKKQIRKAADHYTDIDLLGCEIDEEHVCSAFIRGAEWADANPEGLHNLTDLESELLNKCHQFQSKLQIAIEALDDIKRAAILGDETTTELNCHHLAEDAISKIKDLK